MGVSTEWPVSITARAAAAATVTDAGRSQRRAGDGAGSARRVLASAPLAATLTSAMSGAATTGIAASATTGMVPITASGPASPTRAA